MKKLILCIVFLVFLLSIKSGFSQEIPTLHKYVNDLANVLSASDIDRINLLAAEIEKNTTVEIAVLTVQSTQPMTIEEYAVKTFEENGIGKKDKDNGLLIVAAIQDKKWRFEVGYGLEPIINDAKAGLIGRTYMTPAFREERYGDGLYDAVDAVNKVIQNSGDTSFISEEEFSGEEIWIIVLILLFFVMIPLIIVATIFGFKKCPNCGTRMKCHYDKKYEYIICECPKCGKKVKEKRKRHFWFFVGGFGGRGFGGGGGGGGGFGGGGSGGGGASGGF